MSVLVETTEGNIVIDLFYKSQPLLSFNFIKLCEINYYFFTPFYNLFKDLLISSGDPNYPKGSGGYSINYFADISIFDSNIERDKYLPVEDVHTEYNENGIGLVSFVTKRDSQNELVVGSQFTISLTSDVKNLSSFNHQIPFGKVVEGFSVLKIINDSFLEDIETRRLLKDIRITHTHILYDPFPDISQLVLKKKDATVPSQLQIDNMRFPQLVQSINNENEDESNYQALTLELIGDLPHYKIKPSPRTLFIAKLNPVTTSDSLTTIFNRFGEVANCNVITDHKSGKSLCYGFIEFKSKEQAEKAYGKLHNGCVIDGRNVLIDFSQSVKNL